MTVIITMSDDQIVPELESIVHRKTKYLPNSLPTFYNVQHVKGDSNVELNRQKWKDNPSRSRSCGDVLLSDEDARGRKCTSSGKLQKQDTFDDEVFPSDVEYRQPSQDESTARARRDTYRKSSGYGTQGSKEMPSNSFEMGKSTTVRSLVRQDSAISLEPLDWMRLDQDNLPNLSILLLSGERTFSLVTHTSDSDSVCDQGVPDNFPLLSIFHDNVPSNDDSIELPQDISFLEVERDQDVDQVSMPSNIINVLTKHTPDNENLPTHEMLGAPAELEPSNTQLMKMLIENYLISKNLEMDPSAVIILMRELPSDSSTPNQSPLDGRQIVK